MIWIIVWLFVSNVLAYALGNEGRNKRKDFWITALTTPFLTIPMTAFLMWQFGPKDWRA